jgi:hypothetical protein
MKFEPRGISLATLILVGLSQPGFAFQNHNGNLGTITRWRIPAYGTPLRDTTPLERIKFITMLHAERKEDDVTYDGRGRGRYLFVLVLLICIWQFSIPPTFRRAKFCPPACGKERILCNSKCVRFEDWTRDIVQYYKDGGGIQWDFSIDPNTIAENERFINSIFGSK